MAASLFLQKFPSFPFPTNAPPEPKILPSQLSLPPSASCSRTEKFGYNLVPLVAKDPRHSSSASSSLSSDLSPVICPSLAYANTLFFSSVYNVQVYVDDNEPEDNLIYRFRREVLKAGVIQECKRRRFYENKQDLKKRKSREAARRNRKRRHQLRNSTKNERGVQTTKKEEDEDNSDLPEEDDPLTLD